MSDPPGGTLGQPLSKELILQLLHTLLIILFSTILYKFYNHYKRLRYEQNFEPLHQANTADLSDEDSRDKTLANHSTSRSRSAGAAAPHLDTTTDTEAYNKRHANTNISSLGQSTASKLLLKSSLRNSFWNLDSLNALTERLSKNLPLPSNIIPSSRDQRTGRRLRKRERALILAKRILAIETSKHNKKAKEYQFKKIPQDILEPIDDMDGTTGNYPGSGGQYPEYLKMSKEIQYIQKSIKVFGFLDSSILLSLVKHSELVDLNPEETLFKPGDPDKYIYIIRKGTIDITIDGQQIDRKYPGDSIQSLLSVLDVLLGDENPKIKTVRASAVEYSRIVRLPIEVLTEESRKNPSAMIQIIKIICLRLQRVTLFTLNQYLGISAKLIRSDSEEEKLKEHLLDLNVNQKSFIDKLPIFGTHNVTDNKSKYATTGNTREYDPPSPDILEKILKDVEGELGIRDSDTLVGMSTLLRVSKNTLLLEQKNYKNNKYLYLVSGRMRAYQEFNNEKRLLFTATPGHSCGSLSMVTGEPSFYSLETETECLVLRIEQNDINKILSNEPHVILYLARMVTDRISPFVRQVDFSLDWMNLECGKRLFTQGNIADSAFVVLNGRLRSVVALPNSAKEKVIHTEFGRNEIVGIGDAIRRNPRQSTVHAIRDTELAKLSAGLIEFMRIKYKFVEYNLTKLITTHTNNSTQMIEMDGTGTDASFNNFKVPGKNLSTVAIIGTCKNTPVDMFSVLLQNNLQKLSKQKIPRLTSRNIRKKLGHSALEKQEEYKLYSWLSTLEENSKLVLFFGVG